MAMPNNKGWLAILFILTCLAIPFGITYYVSTETFKDKYTQWRGPMPRPPENTSLEKSRTIDDQVMLVKDERIRVFNTSLIFKGIVDDDVVLDLFLEELDHDHAYPQKFSKNIPRDRVIRLGDVAYKVKGVGQNTLVLKIVQTMGAQ
jgi:hypothetical protein